MTKAQAAALHEQWNLQIDSQRCEHLKQEMETSANGYLTGHYHCLSCGEVVAHHSPQD